MEAVEYLKAKARMTNTCNIGCNNCPLSAQNNGNNLGCSNFESEFSELAVETVEKWAKEHPVKTYLSVLLERFPKASFDSYKVPKLCPDSIFENTKFESCNCPKTCKDCWNREYKEEK